MPGTSEDDARRPRVTLEKLDLLDRAGITTLAAKYRGRPIDVRLNDGGLLGDVKAQQLGSLDYELFEDVMAVNVYAPLAMAEAFQDSMASRAGSSWLPSRRRRRKRTCSGAEPTYVDGTKLPW